MDDADRHPRPPFVDGPHAVGEGFDAVVAQHQVAAALLRRDAVQGVELVEAHPLHLAARVEEPLLGDGDRRGPILRRQSSDSQHDTPERNVAKAHDVRPLRHAELFRPGRGTLQSRVDGVDVRLA